jgi:hypothetical protein
MDPSINETVALIEHIKQLDSAAASEDDLRSHLTELLRFQIGAITRVGDRYRWYRGRSDGELTDQGFANICSISHRDPTKTSRSRANAAGKPVLYASRNPETVRSELGLVEGSLLQLVQLQTQPGECLRSYVIGEWDHIEKANLSMIGDTGMVEMAHTIAASVSYETMMCTVLVDAFFAEQFRRDSKAHAEYKITALISEVIFQQTAAMELDALIYPSVKRGFGFNIAIQPQSVLSKCRFVSTQLQRITRALPFDHWQWRPMKQSVGIGVDGTIVWGPPAMWPLNP